MNERNILIIALFLLIGLFFFSSFSSYSGQYVYGISECIYWPDGVSQDIYHQQTVRYQQDVYSDIPPTFYTSTCTTQTTLSAVRCIDGAQPARYNVDCPSGYICRLGACLEGSFQDSSPGCTDSDDGKVTSVKGVVTVLDARGNNLPTSYPDICATEITVLETSCSSSGMSVNKEILPCPYPSRCVEGACEYS